MRFHQFLTFLYGCSATFLGVFIIAWAPSSDDRSHLDFEERDDGRVAQDVGLGNVGEDERDRVERGIRVRVGSGGGVTRRRAAVVSPGGAPILRRKRSSLGLMGLSPAKHLLLVHTPPRDRPDYLDRDVEHAGTSDSFHRRRAISWFGEERPSRALFTHRGDEADDD
jgi:hypothetical protein